MPGERYRVALEGLTDVDLGTLSDGEVLTYDSTTGLWSNEAVGASLSIDDLDDITITTPADNEVLAYDTGTSEWINQTAAEAALQPADADLTALAALAATAGMLARTGAGAFAVRTIAGTANEIAVANGDGAAGAPTLSLATGIDATKIGGGGVTSAEFDYLAGITSDVQAQINAKQALDADLTALAALAAAAGMLARTGADTFAVRTIAGTANEIAVANGDGAAGAPTLSLATGIDATKIANGTVTSAEFQYLGDVTGLIQAQLNAKQALDADLTAVAGLAATAGMLSRTGAGAFAVRTIAGTANEITVTNGDGAAGAPTLSLASSIDATKIGGGGVTSAEFDYLAGVTSDIQTQFGNKQALDADLTALAALAATAGMLSRTGAGAFVARTLAGTADDITITNGDGAAGAPTFKAERDLEAVVFDFTTACATGDGKFYFTVPQSIGGKNLDAVHARVITAGTTGTMDIQLHNLTQAADMLSTVITIDTGETGSDTAATPAVVDGAEDDVAAYEVIRVDVDAVHTTPAEGLIVTLHFS